MTTEATRATSPHWVDTTEERNRSKQEYLDARWREAREVNAASTGIIAWNPGIGDRPRVADEPPGGDCTRMPQWLFKRPGSYCGEHPERERDEARDTVPEQAMALARLRALLREIEREGPVWFAHSENADTFSGPKGSSCPSCQANRTQGHAPDCRVAAELGTR